MSKPLEIFNFDWAAKLSENDLLAFGGIPVAIIIIAFGVIVVGSVLGRRNWEKIAEQKQ